MLVDTTVAKPVEMNNNRLRSLKTAAAGTEPASALHPPRLRWHLNENDTIMTLSLCGRNLYAFISIFACVYMSWKLTGQVSTLE